MKGVQVIQAIVSLLLAAVLMVVVPATARSDTSGVDPVSLESTLPNLVTRDFNEKSRSISAIQREGSDAGIRVLQALLDGKLFYIKAGKKVVIGRTVDGGLEAADPISGDSLGVFGKRKLKKISVNNKLRKQLRIAIAQSRLASDDASVRLQAATEMMRAMNAESAEVFRKALVSERDERVQEVLATGVALSALSDAAAQVRLDAIAELRGNLQPEVRNRLSELSEKDESDEVRESAAAALRSIETRLERYELIETVFFGISLGSVLVLAAIGLAITFGVMGVINMAHGELIMLGAYTTYVVQLLMPNYIELSLFVAIPAAFVVSGLFGIAIERGIIRFLYGRPLETLLATFGVSLILQQLVRSVFSPLNRAVATPEWMSGSLMINPALSLTLNRLYIVGFTLIVFVALLMILKRTSLGLNVRAVSQNRTMAKAIGVRTERVDALAFGLGSGIAGIAGVALSQLTNVGPNLGQAYIIDSFMVVVFGGVGNLWGTLVSGLSLGIANKFLEPWSGAVLAKIFVLVFIILFIQKYPRGLFPQKGRSAEN